MTPNGTEFAFAGGAKGPLAGDVLLVPLLSKPQPPLELVSEPREASPPVPTCNPGAPLFSR